MPQRPQRNLKKSRQGAMLVLVAVTVILLLIAVAFSVDVAYMQLTRTELRTSTDAAARAATEALSRQQSVAAAMQAARDAAAANPVAGDPLLLADEDILFGHADVLSDGSFGFQEGVTPFNSIRVTGRRTADSPSGPVGLLFAGVFDTDTFRPTQAARTVNLDRDICLVVDRSGSMNREVTSENTPTGYTNWCDGPHPTLSRWAALDEAVTVFLSALNATDLDELVGLVSYSSIDPNCGGRPTAPSTIDAPLSDNYAEIQVAMQRYSDNWVDGWTNIASGIDNGVAVLTDASRTRIYAQKTMVVLTDGQENRPRFSRRWAEAAAAEAVAANEIVIHTITFSDSANQRTMREVARIGGGNHYHAPTAARLEEIFREIALTLPVVMAE